VSTLADVAAGALRFARESLGTSGSDSLSIDGGAPWLVTRAEERHSRDFVLLKIGGQKVFAELVVVGESAEFMAAYPEFPADYLGKSATMGGNSYRVSEISRGEVFTEVSLAGAQESP